MAVEFKPVNLGSDFKRLATPASTLLNVIGDIQDRRVREADKAEEQRRWDIANSRAQRKEDREIAEQSASDAYYKELLKGPQTVGGILNRESVVNQASQFDFTPEEIAFSNTNRISTPEQARKLGNEALAKKMEGQLALSKSVDTMYNQGVLDETRPEMYERALDVVTSKGLPASKELWASLDAARVAEQTAIDNKLKENREAEAKLLKDQRDDLWKVVNARTGGNTFTDADGNTVILPALQREIKAGNKADVSGVNTVQEAINKLGFDKPEKKEAAIKQSNEYVKLLEARGIPTDAAADIVASELSKKESNPWLSYVGFSSMDPKFDTKSINTYADMIAERYNKTTPIGSTSSIGTDSYPSKFELASRLADSNAINTSNELARLRAERAALLGTPEERRGSRIDEFIRPKEPVITTNTSGSTVKLDTKAPQSLVQAEGVRNKPYKDTKGIVTVGVGYAFNKDRAEIESDFKAAGISTSKIDGLMKMDGTELTNNEVAKLLDVSYDRHGVQKLKGIGIDTDKINPTLAEIGVVQAYRGDIVKNGEGYRGKLYEFLKNDDLEGMTNYVKTNKEVPKEVKQRLNLVTDRYGAMTKEQARYEGIPTEANKPVLSPSETKTPITVRDFAKSLLAPKEKDTITVPQRTAQDSELQKRLDIVNEKYKGKPFSTTQAYEQSKAIRDYEDEVAAKKLNKSVEDYRRGLASMPQEEGLVDQGLPIIPAGKAVDVAKSTGRAISSINKAPIRKLTDAEYDKVTDAIANVARRRQEDITREEFTSFMNKSKPSDESIQAAKDKLAKKIADAKARTEEIRVTEEKYRKLREEVLSSQRPNKSKIEEQDKLYEKLQALKKK